MCLTGCGGKVMTMATGGTSGTYYDFGGVLANVVNKNAGVQLTVVSTGASKENIQSINSGSNNLAIVQNDVMTYAYEGTNTFASGGAVTKIRAVGGLYAEQMQIVTLSDDIKTVADLKGKLVSIGAPGSGVYYNAIDILAVYGLTEADIKAQYLSFVDSAEGLKSGEIDAAFIVAGAPTTAMSELATAKPISLVSIDDVHIQKLMAACPYYTPYTIQANTYAGVTNDVQTVAVQAALIVEAKASDEDVYKITKAIFDNIPAIADGHARGDELSLENAVSSISIPFHAGAAKYFAEKGVTVPVA